MGDQELDQGEVTYSETSCRQVEGGLKLLLRGILELFSSKSLAVCEK